MKTRLFLLAALSFAVSAIAQLSVTVSPPKIMGEKAIVPITLKNNLATKIESIRAAVFLLDERTKVLGQGTRWIVGGSNGKPALAPGATNDFDFVVMNLRPITSTNITVKLNINRIVLEGGKLADLNRDVQIHDRSK